MPSLTARCQQTNSTFLSSVPDIRKAMDLKDPWLPCMFYLDATAAFSRWLMPVATVIMSTFRMLDIESRSVIQFRSEKSESSQPILKFGIHRKFPYLCRPAMTWKYVPRPSISASYWPVLVTLSMSMPAVHDSVPFLVHILHL